MAKTETKNKNIVDEVNERIDKLLSDRAATIADIEQHIQEAETDKAAHEKAMDTATKEMDLDAYKTAKDGRANAIITAEMYQRHRKQLKATAYVTDADSEGTIESILEYEKEITAEYEAEAGAIIEHLHEVTDEYRAKIKKAETAVNRWTHDIHKNYISYSGTTYDGSDRSPNPIPVHYPPFEGCALSKSRVYTYDKISREL